MASLFVSRTADGPATVLVSNLVFWAVFLFAIAGATERLGVPIAGAALSAVAAFLPRVAAAVLIVMLGFVLADLARNFVAGTAASARVGGAPRLGRVAQLSILFITAVVAFEELGIQTLFIIVVVGIALAAGLGGAAIAFGLGARTTVSNMIASYYAMKLLRVGQSVRIGEVEGRIVDFTPTSVIIATRAGQVLVPAKEFGERSAVMLAED
jgi:small-conductance mechanosensitive channel